jgi:Ca2+-dependent lipid-binding protein
VTSSTDIAKDLNMREGTDAAEVDGRALSHMPSIVRGVLTVHVQKAEELKAADIGGTSDPFVRLFMRNGDMKKKTKVGLTRNGMLEF